APPANEHNNRVPSAYHAPQSMPSDDAPGGFGGTNWLKLEPSGFTVAGWKRQHCPKLSSRMVWLISSLVPSGDQIGIPKSSVKLTSGTCCTWDPSGLAM